MKAPIEEIYGKSTQGTVKKYTQSITPLSLTTWVYLHSFICSCLPSRKILRKFELIEVQGHPRSSILVLTESSYATTY